jgi:aminopeptidase N
MKNILFAMLLLSTGFAVAQDNSSSDTSWKSLPRYTPSRINNLVHTKLDLRFDYQKAHVLGKAWITLQPHFYPTDSLHLDAKGMDIHEIAIMGPNATKKSLNYTYDQQQLSIQLDKSYTEKQRYTVYISYTAKPDEYEKMMGMDAMLGAKGLYFINPKGEDKNKPTQIWTQGETESSSVWFPTIDQTQQKTTQETLLTVPDKYVTLSNGKLVSQKKNTDGTRTDYWKMELPHAPYLFFVGVGDFAVAKDTWRGKEVNYYVEKEYGPVAKKIFGNTPEMMTYFSKITGVDFPWVKYSQMVGRDYVSGAMENTTATLHQEGAQQDARELTDGNIWEGTIAHELFHQWFGDYVTPESWSNLTLSESFADYSQTLWNEYKYGKDAGDEENFNGMQGYLLGNNAKKDLVRFYYADREDMFDAVSYSKGGRILHMLRNFIGDSAFFKGLNRYLTTNKFKSAEAHHLRLALEEVSGKDLTWYFNQWYFGSGHPKLDITYQYIDSLKTVRVIVKQTQNTGKTFRIPTAVDIYHGSSKKRYSVWVENNIDTLQFSVTAKPDLINFDGDKVLLTEKKENKNLDAYIHQYRFAGNYLDRREAIDFCGRKLDDAKAVAFLKEALNDRYEGIRKLALSKLDIKRDAVKKAVESTLVDQLRKETDRPTKAAMISWLGNTKNAAYRSVYMSNIDDSSYSVSGAALEALYKIDSAEATSAAKRLSLQKTKGQLDAVINRILIASGDQQMLDRMINRFSEMPLSNDKFMMLQQLSEIAAGVKDDDKVKKIIELIVGFRESIPGSVKEQVLPYINNFILQGILNKLKAAGRTELAKSLETAIK